MTFADSIRQTASMVRCTEVVAPMGASDHSHLPYFHDARRKGDALDAFDRFLAGADVDQPVAGHPEGARHQITGVKQDTGAQQGVDVQCCQRFRTSEPHHEPHRASLERSYRYVERGGPGSTNDQRPNSSSSATATPSCSLVSVLRSAAASTASCALPMA